ncbi:efflux RND transporter periplasmic adaptor subunit [Nitrospirillum sp. BR 11163]|uniref:efflux RND transporter periplasmic adaptor subunit n=1 Tax=Nitrospirillum sp. BR 11163 TaxID=3104323 RepID=UPI002AFDEC96|nr:efflux RND transporter periplasmic adaptor subunit [Nitrospirillum sp. BR 11163]MEA1674689.1 efflux RND transporter periplasmic adaptor subunit [Nitrospirillum sp. BR 11163]
MIHSPLPRFAGPALLALTLLAGTAYAQAPQEASPATLTLTDAQAKAAGVETQTPRPAATVASPTYPARLDVFEHYKTIIAAPVPGIVDELVGEVNDAVARGALLARMRSPDMAQAQRDYLLALDAAALAQREAQRDADLVAEGIIAERRQQASRSAAVQADAHLQERRQALLALGLTAAEVETLKRSRKVTDEMTVRAPEDGMILDHGAFPGQRIDSSVPLYTLAKLSPLLLEVQVPAAVATTLHEKDKVRLADDPADAVVESIGHHADPASQTVTVRVLVDNRAGHLRPGLMTAASFLSTGAGAAWALPHDAVVQVAGRPTVFIRRGDKVEAAPISVLSETADAVVAQGPGLAAGSAVVVRGTVVLKGMQAGLGGQE